MLILFKIFIAVLTAFVYLMCIFAIIGACTGWGEDSRE